MRRKDREITDIQEILSVLKRCDTLRIAMNAPERPYIAAVSFGFEYASGEVSVYFHGSGKGLSAALIEENPCVCVQADIFHGYEQIAGGVTARYESVFGFGNVKKLEGGEAAHALLKICEHCGFEGFDIETCKSFGHTAVYKIITDTLTGKRNLPK